MRSSKLSKLQKAILRLAFANKEGEGRGFGLDSGADVYYSEILAVVFQFPTRKQYALPLRRLPGRRIFAPAEIGLSRYRSAEVAISRAVLRLHIRRLAKSVHSRHSTWAGASLTPAGVAIARALETPCPSSGRFPVGPSSAFVGC
jgi:hypothetical protein